MNLLNIENRSNIEKRIVGALKDGITAHGNIDLNNVSSTAKRIYSLLKGIAKEQRRIKN